MEALVWITFLLIVPVTLGTAVYLKWKMRSRPMGSNRVAWNGREDIEVRLNQLETDIEGIKQTLRGQGT